MKKLLLLFTAVTMLYACQKEEDVLDISSPTPTVNGQGGDGGEVPQQTGTISFGEKPGVLKDNSSNKGASSSKTVDVEHNFVCPPIGDNGDHVQVLEIYDSSDAVVFKGTYEPANIEGGISTVSGTLTLPYGNYTVGTGSSYANVTEANGPLTDYMPYTSAAAFTIDASEVSVELNPTLMRAALFVGTQYGFVTKATVRSSDLDETDLFKEEGFYRGYVNPGSYTVKGESDHGSDEATFNNVAAGSHYIFYPEIAGAPITKVTSVIETIAESQGSTTTAGFNGGNDDDYLDTYSRVVTTTTVTQDGQPYGDPVDDIVGEWILTQDITFVDEAVYGDFGNDDDLLDKAYITTNYNLDESLAGDRSQGSLTDIDVKEESIEVASTEEAEDLDVNGDDDKLDKLSRIETTTTTYTLEGDGSQDAGADNANISDTNTVLGDWTVSEDINEGTSGITEGDTGTTEGSTEGEALTEEERIAKLVSEYNPAFNEENMDSFIFPGFEYEVDQDYNGQPGSPGLVFYVKSDNGDNYYDVGIGSKEAGGYQLLHSQTGDELYAQGLTTPAEVIAGAKEMYAYVLANPPN